jgi:hypothetical protein
VTVTAHRTRREHCELQALLVARDDWEDIVLRANEVIGFGDNDYFGTHWLLEEYKEDGILSDEQWFHFEHNINESAFAEFMRCMNGMCKDCK